MFAEEKVFEIIGKLCGTAVNDPNLRLREDLGFDSLNMVLILIEIENGFSFRLNEVDMNPYAIKTVGNVVSLVKIYTEPKTDATGNPAV
jgi:acyl carrier protein